MVERRMLEICNEYALEGMTNLAYRASNYRPLYTNDGLASSREKVTNMLWEEWLTHPPRDAPAMVASIKRAMELRAGGSESTAPSMVWKGWSTLFGVLGSRCLTGSALLDCHGLKGFGIYMIGILDSLSDVWKASTGTPPCKLLRVNTLR